MPTPMSRSDRILDSARLIRLLQLASPALPLGGYSYSEGLEYAIHAGILRDGVQLRGWLEDTLRYGTAAMEAAIVVRVYDAAGNDDSDTIRYWDRWLTAARESEELREQSLDMGRALMRLYYEIEPPGEGEDACFRRERCNLATAFGLVAARADLPRTATVTAFLQSGIANLISVGVKLIPLGQTEGQKLLWSLQSSIEEATELALARDDDDLGVSHWGLALASMAHETQYSRLFRS